jgi:transcriptional regulator
LSTKADQLEWRRAKVVEMRVTGLSFAEIARELQVSKASITMDVKHIREYAKQSIREYITEQLPEQYQVCLAALDTIIRHAYEILRTSEDNREKLQASVTETTTRTTRTAAAAAANSILDSFT